jgi:hypothetical protein
MGIISQAVIAPPFVWGVEHHTLTKNPTFKPVLIQRIFFNKHLGKTAIFKMQGFYGVRI